MEWIYIQTSMKSHSSPELALEEKIEEDEQFGFFCSSGSDIYIGSNFSWEESGTQTTPTRPAYH